MLTFEQIKSMSNEEVTALNKKLARKMMFNFIVIPVAITVAGMIIVKKLDKKFEN